MSAAATQESGPHQTSPTQIGEWFWRFLAVVMLVVIGWVVWIAIQISPSDVFLPAAYEAAAQGRASRNSAGPIGGVTADAPATPIVATAPTPPTPPTSPPAEPPVNLEKLKRAESIETPIPDGSGRAK